MAERLKAPVSARTCPHCGTVHPELTPVRDSKRLRRDMVSICSRCLRLALYNADLTLRKATDADMKELRRSSAWPTIVRIQIRMLDAAADVSVLRPPGGEG